MQGVALASLPIGLHGHHKVAAAVSPIGSRGKLPLQAHSVHSVSSFPTLLQSQREGSLKDELEKRKYIGGEGEVVPIPCCFSTRNVFSPNTAFHFLKSTWDQELTHFCISVELLFSEKMCLRILPVRLIWIGKQAPLGLICSAVAGFGLLHEGCLFYCCSLLPPVCPHPEFFPVYQELYNSQTMA